MTKKAKKVKQVKVKEAKPEVQNDVELNGAMDFLRNNEDSMISIKLNDDSVINVFKIVENDTAYIIMEQNDYNKLTMEALALGFEMGVTSKE